MPGEAAVQRGQTRDRRRGEGFVQSASPGERRLEQSQGGATGFEAIVGLGFGHLRRDLPLCRAGCKTRPMADEPTKPLSEAAKRALAEAEARRAEREAMPEDEEIGGPAGLEPTRFGDWERKGIAVDF